MKLDTARSRYVVVSANSLLRRLIQNRFKGDLTPAQLLVLQIVFSGFKLLATLKLFRVRTEAGFQKWLKTCVSFSASTFSGRTLEDLPREVLGAAISREGLQHYILGLVRIAMKCRQPQHRPEVGKRPSFGILKHHRGKN